MKLENYSKDELESMQFNEIAYLILKENGDKMKIADLFKKVCELQNLSDDVYENQIADFFTLLSTEKRFVHLEQGYWDIKEKHSIKMEDDEEEDDEEDEDEELEERDDIDTDEDDNGEVREDLKDLVIIEEDELEDNL